MSGRDQPVAGIEWRIGRLGALCGTVLGAIARVGSKTVIIFLVLLIYGVFVGLAKIGAAMSYAARAMAFYARNRDLAVLDAVSTWNGAKRRVILAVASQIVMRTRWGDGWASAPIRTRLGSGEEVHAALVLATPAARAAAVLYRTVSDPTIVDLEEVFGVCGVEVDRARIVLPVRVPARQRPLAAQVEISLDGMWTRAGEEPPQDIVLSSVSLESIFSSHAAAPRAAAPRAAAPRAAAPRAAAPRAAAPPA